MIVSVVALLGALSCVNGAKEITQVDYTRVLAPTDIEAVVLVTGDQVAFSWTKSKGATDFEVELFSDPELDKKVGQFTVPVDELPFVYKLLADETYYFRVRGIDAGNILEPSKWSVYTDSNTGEPKAIKTYAIKSSVDPVVLERTQSTVTLGWTLPEGDTEITHVLVKNASGNEVEFPVEQVGTGVKIEGLEPSKFYSLTVHYKSANRGSVVAWTRPANDGSPVQVQDTVALKQAVKDGAQYIKVLRNDADTTYVVGEMNLTAPLKIVGDADAQGNKPAIAGRFTVGAGCTSFRAEDIAFSGYAVAAKGEEGGMSQQTHLFTVNDVATFENVEFVNINVEGYQRGLYYDNKGGSVNGTLLFDGVRVDDITGSGGDNIDIRQTCNIASVILRNSTFNGGTRTFLRVDAKPVLGQLIVEQCTFNNMCYNGSDLVIGGSNVQGILAVKANVTTFVVKKNVFLNNQCWLVGGNTACKVPVFEKNYVYNSVPEFYTSAKLDGSGARSDMKKEVVLAEGGVEVSADPCYDSMGDKFNLVDDRFVKAGVGDPRWFQPYIYVPEDLTQDPTSAVHTWDFSNSKVFYKQAEEDMVRDGIRFYVGGGDPIAFGGSVTFPRAAEMGADGTPVASAMSIKVDAPGSLVLSSEVGNGAPCSFVLMQDGVPVGAVASGEIRKQVVFADVQEGTETMIYICPTGPGSITEMQWNSETVYVAVPQLETPEIKLSAAKATQGDEITLTITAVENADSYNVSIDGGKDTSIKDLESAIKTGSLTAGEHTVSVSAVPAGWDMLRKASKAAEAKFELKEKPAPTPGGTAGLIEFSEAANATVENGASFEDGSIKIEITNSANPAKQAIDENKAYFGDAEKYQLFTKRLKTGGNSGSTNAIKLTVEEGASGTLYIYARTGKDAEERKVALSKDGVEVVSKILHENQSVTVDIEGTSTKVYESVSCDVTAGVYDFSYNSIYIYGIEFVPAGGGESTKVDKVWDFSTEAWTTAMSSVTKNTDDSNWNLDVDGLKMIAGGGSIKWNMTDAGLYYFQIGGAGSTTKRYFEYTAEVDGVLSAWVSNTGDSEELTRKVTVKVGDADEISQDGGYAASAGPHQVDFNVSAGTIKIYPTVKGLRFYKIEFHSK